MRALLAAACLALANSPALAGTDFDGSKPLLCASLEAAECEPSEHCDQGRPDDMGLPVFMRIDFAKKEIIGSKRTSPIRSLEKESEQILLQGNELGFVWVIAVDQTNGQMTGTITNRQRALVVFGSCIAQ